MLLRACCAPSRYVSTTPCGNEFVPNSPHQLYCSPKCATRAHRKAAKANKIAKRAGMPTPRPGFPEDMAQRLAFSALATETGVTTVAVKTVAGETVQSVVAPDEIVQEVKRLEQIDAITSIDETAILRKLGYLPQEDRTRGIEPQRQPQPDRSAEPRPGTKVSTEDEPPDFRDHGEPTGPIDYNEGDL